VAIPQFDTFIAIDWSGAAQHYDGIAVAVCGRGETAPELVEPQGRRWTRSAVARYLEELLSEQRRVLIGLDFAFAFPFEAALGYLAGHAPEVTDVFSLWSLIETKSAGDPDFGCTRFINDPSYRPLFWTAGPKPQHWIERKRRTEHACAETTQTRPDTLYKLLHSKQVGKASITGIRVLHHVRSRKGQDVAIWPFEIVRTSAMVEIYPTLFRKMATRSIAKLRSHTDLNYALDRVGSRQMKPTERREPSDHESDALLSAAGLRWIADDPGMWTPAALDSTFARREGWIFGVQL
jgi:hypothetical protein